MSKLWDSREFKARLSKLPAAIKRADSAALEQNAGEWVAMSKSLAPQDKGALLQSIEHHRTETGGQIVQAGGDKTTREVRSGSGVAIDYAVQQEFGNEEMAPSPFFWPAYRSFKKRFKSRRNRALSKALKEI
jgi:HK97 gp10 family phage protein